MKSYLHNGPLVDLYRKLGLSFQDVIIPVKPRGLDRLIVVAEGVAIQQSYDWCASKFKCWKYIDRPLDEIVTINERDPKKGAYAIWVRNVKEADYQHKNKSANDIKREKLTTETFLERLLHGYDYYMETGEHLDTENITLCAGSRDADGHVPRVFWYGYDDEMRVGWCNPGYSRDYLHSREVVAA